jgi:hypothetical protein
MPRRRKKNNRRSQIQNQLRSAFTVQQRTVHKLNRDVSVVQTRRSRPTDVAKDVLNSIRTSVAPALYSTILDWHVHAYPFLYRNSGGSRLRSLTNLGPKDLLPTCSLKQELYWAFALIEQDRALLEEFIIHSRNLTDHVHHTDSSGATSVLDAIEKTTGQSMWLIEARIATLQYFSGLEKQKQYVNAIQSDAPQSFSGAIAFWVSRRNEETVSTLRFNEDFRQELSGWMIPESLKIYLDYRITGFTPTDRRALADILAVEATMSRVDLFETTITILSTLISTADVVEKSMLFSLLKSVQPLHDERFTALTALLGMQEESYKSLNLNNNILRAGDSWVSGNLLNASALAKTELSQSPSNALAIFQAARYTDFEIDAQPTLGFTNTIVQHLSAVLQRGSVLKSATAHLDKISRNFRFLPIAPVLLALVGRFDLKLRIENQQLAIALFIASPMLHPIHVVAFELPEAKSYATECFRKLGSRPCVHYALVATGAQVSLSHDLSRTSALWAQYQFARWQTDRPTMLALLTQLDEIGDISSQRETHSEKIKLLWHLENHGEAINAVANYATQDPEGRRSLPLQMLFSEREYNDFKPYRQTPHIHVALSTYIEEFEDRDALVTLRSLWDEIIDGSIIKQPTDLADPKHGYSVGLVVYFLDHVCSEEVMDISTIYESSNDITLERLHICERLIELDPENASRYRDEIFLISKGLKVDEGRARFDQSRVQVNLDALTRWAHRELDERFKRFERLVNAGLGGSDRDFEVAIERIYTTENSQSASFENVVENEASDLLVRIIGSFFTQYMQHPEYGLDSYLSLRVRHGSLTGTISGPFDMAGMLLIHVAANGGYSPPNTLLRLVPNLTDEQRSSIFVAFITFTEKFQQITDRLSGELFHVRSSHKPEGIFPNHLGIFELNTIRAQFHTDHTLDNLIYSCATVFTYAISKSLATAKQVLNEQTIHDTETAVDRLREQLNSILQPQQRVELDNLITNAFSDTQRAILEVAEWFRGDFTEQLQTSFTFDQILDVALEATKRSYRGRPFQIDRNIDITEPQGVDVLTEVVDILFILFANALTHSEVPGGTDIVVQAYKIDQLLTIRVENSVAPFVQNAATLEKLARIRTAMSSGDYLLATRTEGGSGLMKLKKIAALHPNHSLDFGFDGAQSFFAEVSLSMRSIPVDTRKALDTVVSA